MCLGLWPSVAPACLRPVSGALGAAVSVPCDQKSAHQLFPWRNPGLLQNIKVERETTGEKEKQNTAVIRSPPSRAGRKQAGQEEYKSNLI